MGRELDAIYKELKCINRHLVRIDFFIGTLLAVFIGTVAYTIMFLKGY